MFQTSHPYVVAALLAVLLAAPPATAASVDSDRPRRSDGLVLASQQGMTMMVSQLLARGTDVNGTDARGYTPLIAAAKLGHIEVVGLLLSYGAKVDAAERSGYTALAWAVRQNRPDVVDLLLERGASPHQPLGRSLTPLELAKKLRYRHLVARMEKASRREAGWRPALEPLEAGRGRIWTEDQRRAATGVVGSRAGQHGIAVSTEDAPARSRVVNEDQMPR